MLKKILLVLVVVSAVFVAVVIMQPTDYRITRSMVMNAPPAAVFNEVNSFHNWQAWSPWAKLDPKAEAKFEGPDAGEGATFKWKGNSEIGVGSMKIVESKPDELIKIDLEFIEPMPGKSDTLFTFKPVDGKTETTWTMTGKHDFASKAMCLFMNMDKMIGGSFEEGLTNIKKVVEKPAQADPTGDAGPDESTTSAAAGKPATTKPAAIDDKDMPEPDDAK